jgi:hypothetical protein
MIHESGCRRAPIDVTSTSWTCRSVCACVSSSISPCVFNPSSVDESAPSGSNFEPIRSHEMLFRNVRTNGFSSGDAFTIFVAPSWTIFAWSFFVAAE